jgi:hypothetical protein
MKAGVLLVLFVLGSFAVAAGAPGPQVQHAEVPLDLVDGRDASETVNLLVTEYAALDAVAVEVRSSADGEVWSEWEPVRAGLCCRQLPAGVCCGPDAWKTGKGWGYTRSRSIHTRRSPVC